MCPGTREAVIEVEPCLLAISGHPCRKVRAPPALSVKLYLASRNLPKSITRVRLGDWYWDISQPRYVPRYQFPIRTHSNFAVLARQKMKRKKQLEEAEKETRNDEDDTVPKRIRSRLRATGQEDAQDGLDNSPVRRRSSRRGVEPAEDGRELSQEHEQVQPNCTQEESANGSEDEAQMAAKALDGTPKKGLRGRPKSNTNGDLQERTPQKGLLGKNLFPTPAKTNGTTEDNETPKIERNADRSARRKSTRTMIERVILGNTSENEEEEEDVAQHIYDSEDDDALEAGDETIEAAEDVSPPETPSKRKGKQKGTKTRRPTPPLAQDLPPHEKYFIQNRPGRAKTSNNNLSTLALLDHEEYFSLLRKIKDRHAEDIEFLQGLHEKSFNQWQFELTQGFNICTYGWGSKRSLLLRFADYVYKSQKDHAKVRIVVINGYVPTLAIRDVLNTVAAAVTEPGHKMGSQPAEMLENVLALLEEDKTQNVTLVIHSIDRGPLRRPTTQTILSRLSSHPQVHLVASADHPSFPLLWDSSLRSTYNFLFHDCTTFQPYNAETDVVDEVHELLGRSGRRIGGKEGVSFVLKSLPENAKNLFRILITEQLPTMDETSGVAFGGNNGDDDHDDNEQRIGTARKGEVGVEYRVLYQKAVEEFICSNEMNFRTLLKE